jgi:hypothetical protein
MKKYSVKITIDVPDYIEAESIEAAYRKIKDEFSGFRHYYFKKSKIKFHVYPSKGK